MIEATYTVTQSEFVEATKAYCQSEAKKVPGNAFLQIATLALMVSAVISTTFTPVWLGAATWISLSAVLIVQAWRKRAVPAYQANSYREFNEEVTVRFSANGFESEKAELSHSWIAWRSFDRWQETEHMLILGMKLSWIPIPKRAVTSQQLKDLRALLRVSILPRV